MVDAEIAQFENTSNWHPRPPRYGLLLYTRTVVRTGRQRRRRRLLIGGGHVRTKQQFDIVVTEREHELVLSVKQQQVPGLAVKLAV